MNTDKKRNFLTTMTQRHKEDRDLKKKNVVLEIFIYVHRCISAVTYSLFGFQGDGKYSRSYIKDGTWREKCKWDSEHKTHNILQ